MSLDLPMIIGPERLGMSRTPVDSADVASCQLSVAGCEYPGDMQKRNAREGLRRNSVSATESAGVRSSMRLSGSVSGDGLACDGQVGPRENCPALKSTRSTRPFTREDFGRRSGHENGRPVVGPGWLEVAPGR